LREIAVHLVYDVPIKEKCWNSLQCSSSSFIDDRPANPSSFVEIQQQSDGQIASRRNCWLISKTTLLQNKAYFNILSEAFTSDWRIV
jgi:hypothetical protein